MNEQVRSRRATVAVVVLGATVLTLLNALLWVATARLGATDESVAGAQAATIIPATGLVQLRQLRETMILRCRVIASDETHLYWEATPEPGIAAVVTSVQVSHGEEVAAGDMAVEVSGRPVIVLPGRFPAYRDLVLDDSGPDVAQMQRALAELGLRAEEPSGVMDAATVRQSDMMYERVGYESGSSRGVAAVPRSEVVYVDGLPRIVAQPPRPLGSRLAQGESVLVLAGTRLQADCPITAAQELLLSVGMEAEMELDDGTRVAATVGELTVPVQRAAAPEDPNARRLRLTPAEALSEGRLGQTALVTVVLSGDSTRRLAVPTTAIVNHADGTAIIVVEAAEGRLDDIRVRLGAAAGGWVAIDADDRSIVAGTRVQLGG